MLLSVVAGLLLVVVACGGGGTSPDSTGITGDKPLVLVSTSILGDIVRNIAGEDAEVEVLIPIGIDAHDFQPSAREAARLRGADLVIVNGLGLEETLLDTVQSAADDGVSVLELAPELDPVPFGESQGDGAGQAGGSARLDPHVWFDPVRMARAAELIGDRLAQLGTRIPPDVWRQRSAAYRDQILAADSEIAALVATLPRERRKLVTNHEALGYFARRYGFEVIGVVIPGGSTSAESSAADIVKLLDEIDRARVPAIFAETVASTDLAESLAREAGRNVKVVILFTESLGEAGSGADTYLGMLKTDAQLIVDALSQ